MKTNNYPYSNVRRNYPSFSPGGYNSYGRVQLFAYAYYRLSQEEAEKTESSSISNQKKIVEAYCQQHGITILKYFVDDGWSGGIF